MIWHLRPSGMSCIVAGPPVFLKSTLTDFTPVSSASIGPVFSYPPHLIILNLRDSYNEYTRAIIHCCILIFMSSVNYIDVWCDEVVYDIHVLCCSMKQNEVHVFKIYRSSIKLFSVSVRCFHFVCSLIWSLHSPYIVTGHKVQLRESNQ